MPQTTVTADHVERTERFECIRCRTDGRPVAEGRGGCELYGTMVTVTSRVSRC